MGLYYILCICPSVDGSLHCFHFVVIVNYAAVNICVQSFVWTFVFISLGDITRSRISRLCGNSMFNFLRDCQTFFQGDCIILWLPWWLSGKELGCQAGDVGGSLCCKELPWKRKWQPTPVILAWEISRTEEPGGLQSVGSQESDTTWPLHHHRHIPF